jgi:hypothetical protein
MLDDDRGTKYAAHGGFSQWAFFPVSSGFGGWADEKSSNLMNAHQNETMVLDFFWLSYVAFQPIAVTVRSAAIMTYSSSSPQHEAPHNVKQEIQDDELREA